MFSFQGADPNEEFTNLSSDSESELEKVDLLDTIIRLPLHISVTRGCVTATRCLLDAGADINLVHDNEPDDIPVIVRAVDNVDLAMVKLLLKYKPDLNGTVTDCAYTWPTRRAPSLNLEWRLGLNMKRRGSHCQLPLSYALDRLNDYALWNGYFLPYIQKYLHRRNHVQEKDLKEIRDKLILIIRLLLRHGADTRLVLHFHKIPNGSWLLNIEPGFFPLVLVETFCKYIPDKKRKICFVHLTKFSKFTYMCCIRNKIQIISFGVLGIEDFFYLLVISGDVRQVAMVLKYHRDLVNRKFGGRDTPLMIAARSDVIHNTT